MFTRRQFITTTGALLMTTLLPGETLAAPLADRISDTWQKINATRNSGGIITVESIVQTLSFRRVPQNSGVQFLNLCAGPVQTWPVGWGYHGLISAGIRRLPSQSISCRGFTGCRWDPGKEKLIKFDWASLPIPPAILGILPQTQGFHDTVFFHLKTGKCCLMPPGIWRCEGRVSGHAIMGRKTSTWGVTSSQINTLQAVVLPSPGEDIYSANKMSWPQREKTMEFNQAINAWFDELRAKRDDWCTIVHSDLEATRLSLKTCLGFLS
jgi:hypothetical protein